MAKQLLTHDCWGPRPQTPGGFAARMKLGAPPQPPGGFTARMELGAPTPDDPLLKGVWGGDQARV